MKKRRKFKGSENFRKRLQIARLSWMLFVPKELLKPTKGQQDKNRESKLEFVRKELTNCNELGWIKKVRNKKCWKNKHVLRRLNLMPSSKNKDRLKNSKKDLKMRENNC